TAAKRSPRIASAEAVEPRSSCVAIRPFTRSTSAKSLMTHSAGGDDQEPADETHVLQKLHELRVAFARLRAPTGARGRSGAREDGAQGEGRDRARAAEEQRGNHGELEEPARADHSAREAPETEGQARARELADGA